MYNYDYFDPYQEVTNNGGIVAYFLFIKPKTKNTNKYLIWAKDFFEFKTMVIEDLLKVLYLGMTIYITLVSFMLIPESFIKFLIVIVGGNVLLRLAFEGMLMLVMIWKNTSEINKKLKK